MFELKYYFLFYFLIKVECQLAKMVDGLAEQTDNCNNWSKWGECVWVKGVDESDQHWNKPFFDQLTPECRNGFFYGQLREKHGEAIEEGLEYLKSIGRDVKPCGMCSYRHSCGTDCTTTAKKDHSYINRWFTAEQLCTSEMLGGWSQETACTAQYDAIPEECQLWPDNPHFNLSGIDEKLLPLVKAVELFSCKKSKGLDGKPKCRCCCFPYKPDPQDWKCKIPTTKPF